MEGTKTIDQSNSHRKKQYWPVLWIAAICLFAFVAAFFVLSVYRLTARLTPGVPPEVGAAALQRDLQELLLDQARLLVHQELQGVQQELASQQQLAFHLQTSQTSTEQKLAALHRQILDHKQTVAQLQETVGQSSISDDGLREMISRSEQDANRIKLSATDTIDEIKSAQNQLSALMLQLESIEGMAPVGAGDGQHCSEDQSSLTVEVRRQAHLLEELQDSLSKASAQAADAVDAASLEDAFSQSRLPSSPEAVIEKAEEKFEYWVKTVVEDQVKTTQCVNSSEVEEIVEEAVERFEADRVGLPDFAVRTAGGRVVAASGLTSPSYTPASSFVPTKIWHTLGVETGVGPPEEVITQDSSPGRCWAFPGDKGKVTIQLARPAVVEAVSLEHVSKAMALDLSSAPKMFRVWGLKSVKDRNNMIALGSFEYSFEHPSSVQTFKTLKVNEELALVMLEVLSNHGNSEYTCVYRFRVHGQ